MYKASTYFTSVFLKLRVSDKEIRARITNLYNELVKTVLNRVPESRRILVLKLISQAIKDSVDYLRKERDSDKGNSLKNPAALGALRALVKLNTRLILDIGLRSSTSANADRILNEAFLSDIACDIGECIRDFNDATCLRARIDIVKRLRTLLEDYNTVQGTSLTVRGVLERRSLEDSK